jgi:hypothetical protein
VPVGGHRRDAPRLDFFEHVIGCGN